MDKELHCHIGKIVLKQSITSSWCLLSLVILKHLRLKWALFVRAIQFYIVSSSCLMFRISVALYSSLFTFVIVFRSFSYLVVSCIFLGSFALSIILLYFEH